MLVNKPVHKPLHKPIHEPKPKSNATSAVVKIEKTNKIFLSVKVCRIFGLLQPITRLGIPTMNPQF